MSRTLVFVLAWLAVTAAAVGVAWAGVQIVSTRVVEPLPPEALAAASGDADPPATAPAGPSAPAPTAADVGAAVEPTTAPSPAPAAAPAPAATAAPGEGTTPAPELRSYRVEGGSVTLRFAPGQVTVVAAVPADDDFDLDLEGNGTAEATVEFESDDHRSRVRGWWEDGPADRVEEVDRDGSDDDVDDDADDDADDGGDADDG